MGEMNPLRRRMIEDMTIRNLSPATQRSYVHAVLKFSQFVVARPTGSAWRMFEPIRCI
jgi:integrase/recombinase XerD